MRLVEKPHEWAIGNGYKLTYVREVILTVEARWLISR